MHPCICRVGSIRGARQMCERAVAQKALLRTRGQTEMRSWKFDSAGAVAITGILGEQCNQVDNSVPGRRGEERERQTKNRDESSRHRSLSLSRHHWVGLGVLWELVRRWTFVFDSHKAVSPPQQPVNILYGFTVKEKVASALAPSTRSTPADTSEIELQGVLLKSVGCGTRLRHAACP